MIKHEIIINGDERSQADNAIKEKILNIGNNREIMVQI